MAKKDSIKNSDKNAKNIYVYKFKLEPDVEQELFFQKNFGCVRKIWNLMLGSRIDVYKKVKSGELEKVPQFTPSMYKEEYPYLKEVDSLALSNVQQNLNTAYVNFFNRKAGFPKFKSKKDSKKSYTTNSQLSKTSGLYSMKKDNYL